MDKPDGLCDARSEAGEPERMKREQVRGVGDPGDCRSRRRRICAETERCWRRPLGLSERRKRQRVSDAFHSPSKNFSDFRLGWVKLLHLDGITIVSPLFSAFMLIIRRWRTTDDGTFVLERSEVVSYWLPDGKACHFKRSFALSERVRLLTRCPDTRKPASFGRRSLSGCR